MGGKEENERVKNPPKTKNGSDWRVCGKWPGLGVEPGDPVEEVPSGGPCLVEEEGGGGLGVFKPPKRKNFKKSPTLFGGVLGKF